MIYDSKIKPKIESLVSKYYKCKNDLTEKEIYRLEDEIIKVCEEFAFSKTLRGRPYPLMDDLHQTARLGILNAIRTYEPSKGSFCTHLIWQVRGTIIRDKAEQWMKIPAYMKDFCRKLVRFENSWMKEFGEKPNDDLLLEEFHWTQQRLNKVRHAVSLYATDLDIEKAETFDMANVINTRLDVTSALELLPEDQRDIVNQFYFEGRKVQEIAKKLNIRCSEVKHVLHECVKIMAPAMEGYETR